MRLSDFVGQEEARLGLLLNAVDPRCGGLLLVGERVRQIDPGAALPEY